MKLILNRDLTSQIEEIELYASVLFGCTEHTITCTRTKKNKYWVFRLTSRLTKNKKKEYKFVSTQTDLQCGLEDFHFWVDEEYTEHCEKENGE